MHVTVDDRKLWAEVAGQGPPLVFLHGFPLDHRMWAAQISEFSSTHQIIAPDLRGFGKSGPADPSTSMDSYADDVRGGDGDS